MNGNLNSKDVGGLIAFDDSHWATVQTVIRYLLANRQYEIAKPEIIITPPPETPTLASKVLRFAGQFSPRLATKPRLDFLVPNSQLGMNTRCVILHKLAEDDRDGQSSACHLPFLVVE